MNIEERKASISAIREAYVELREDMSKCLSVLEKDNRPQFWRRTTIHTLFALNEGATYFIKQMLLLYSDAELIELSVPDIVLLREESYELSKGKARVRKAKLRAADNFKFAFSLLHSNFDTEYEFNVDGSEWQMYLKALNMRDRITHPKTVNDTFITDDEIVVVCEAASFLYGNYIAFEVGLKNSLERWDL